MDMLFLVQAFKAITPFLARNVDINFASKDVIGSTLSLAGARYRKVLIREVLCVLGLTRQQTAALLQSSLAANAVVAINRLVMHFAREQFTIFDGIPEPRTTWDLEKFWLDYPPAHLREFQEILNEAIERSMLDARPIAAARREVIARCMVRTQTRAELFRDRMKRELYMALDGRFPGNSLTADEVTNFIDGYVNRNRRDFKFETDGVMPMDSD